MNDRAKPWMARCIRSWKLGALVLIGALFGCRALLAAEPGVVDTTHSPYAKVRTVGLDQVHWTRGFWAERFDLCKRVMVPSMWRIMKGTNYTQFFQNFRIAAGLAKGHYHGAPFNDGDFYKWLEAASAVAGETKEPKLDKLLDRITGVIAKAQRADGYIDMRVLIHEHEGDTNAQPFRNPLNFDMYNLGHLFTAACINYRATGKTNLLEVACKAADFLCRAFQHPTLEMARDAICPSHYMGIVELYRATHDPRYLRLAKEVFAARNLIKHGGDDNQDRIPFKDQTQAVGHAVRANYLYAGAADLYMETGNSNLWRPLSRIWTNAVEKKMYITGGCGALYDGASPYGAKNQRTITRVHQAYGYNYQLPNVTAHNETCANIANVLWNWRMFLATGQARFMDVVERALYNSVLSGVSLDGTNFFYTNPLRTIKPLPTPLRWPRTRVPFLNVFCCPPNLVRTVAEVANYAYAKSGDTVWVNLYGGSTLDTELPDGQQVKLTQATEYPWNGRIRITINQCTGKEFALKLRIPGWAKGATVRINDGPPDSSPKPASYFEIRRNWQPGDFVDLNLPMPPRLMAANPLVEEDLNQVAVQRGPLVYCLESTDLPRGAHVMDVTIPPRIHLITRYVRRLLGGVVVLEGTALYRPSQDWQGRLYQEFHPVAAKPFRLRLIPYYAWENRGRSEMSVWLPLESDD